MGLPRGQRSPCGDSRPRLSGRAKPGRARVARPLAMAVLAFHGALYSEVALRVDERQMMSTEKTRSILRHRSSRIETPSSPCLKRAFFASGFLLSAPVAM